MTVSQLRRALGRHRLDKGLSYERLAAAIGAEYVTGATVKRFIDGTTEPHETTVYKIERYLEGQGRGAVA